MRPVTGKRIVAALAAGGLTLAVAACGDAPDKTPSGSGTSAAAAYSACMVTDTGGIDDRSFNASAWAGMQAAKSVASNVNPSYVASTAEADYEPNLRSFVTKKCNFILAVGGLMSDATKKVAAENTGSQFAIVDSAIAGATNVYPMQFATDEAAFLAGYLAAGYSKTGKVATYGGLKIPPVTVFMDGFADGVAQYNKVKSKNVQVIGWDKAKQNGTFAESFVDQNKGKSITNTFVAQGADVVMPVAGGTGLGAATTAQASSGKVSVIWVDVDGCESAPQYCSVFLSTVYKNISDAVQKTVTAAAGGTFASGASVGTLDNGGTGLSPFHDFDSKVPAELKSELTQIQKDIISGKIAIKSKVQPKAA